MTARSPFLSATAALRLTAASGALAVALGAFGAHALKATLLASGREDTWRTAVLYHLAHTAVMLALCLARTWRPGPWLCLAAGNLVFAGSLYALCVTGIGVLGAVTPLGGLSYIAGWVWLAFSAAALKAD